MKALSSVLFQSQRIVIVATVKEKGSHLIGLCTVNRLMPTVYTLDNMNNTDNHSGHPRPYHPPPRVIYLPSVCTYVAQAARAGEALGDGVGGDQTESPVGADQVEGSPKKVSYQVGSAVASGV